MFSNPDQYNYQLQTYQAVDGLEGSVRRSRYLQGARITVTTTATMISSLNDEGDVRTKFFVNESSKIVYLRDSSGVAIANDFALHPGQTIELEGFYGSIYGIVASGTAVVATSTQAIA